MKDTLRILVEKNARLLDRYDPDEAIKYFDTVPLQSPYHYVPEKLRELWSNINQDIGEDGFEAFQKITMLRLMERFESRSFGRRYSGSIREQFDKSFQRITRSINNESFEKYRSNNDILLKDLAICRQKVFPAGGARIVEPKSGFPRALMFKGGPIQSMRVSLLLIRLRGNKPFYSHHMHLSELKQFNPRDFEACNLRLAEMLKLNPEIKGVHCGSWLYDPALRVVSPRLAYMRELQQDNGAFVFYAGISLDGGALAKSKNRQDLYKQGKYVPKSFHIVWPRKHVIAWAERSSKNYDGCLAGIASASR